MALTLDQLKSIPGLFGADQTIPWGTVNYGDVYGQEQPGSANMPSLAIDPSSLTQDNFGWYKLPTAATGGKQLYWHYGEPAQGTPVGSSYGAGGGANGEFPGLYERALLGGNDPEKNLGFLVDSAPVARQVMSTPDESWFSQFMQGPAIPLFSFLGAGAMGAGGMGNFLGSFGEGVGAAGGAMDMGVGLGDVFGLGDVPWGVNPQSGGNMFDPLADFGGDYFSGASDFTGGADLSGIDNWLANEGNFTNDILGTGPKLPNGTPVDLFLANTAKTLGVTPMNLLNMFKDSGGFSKGLGNLLAAGLGAYGANRQANSLMDIANQARADRQPYLNASLSYLTNPNAYFAGPGKSAMDATLRGLSASVGNPIGSPTAMGIATEAGLKDWRNAVTGFGNMGLAGQDTRASLQAQAAQADAGALNALGYGLNSVLNPQPSLTDVVKALNLGGLA